MRRVNVARVEIHMYVYTQSVCTHIVCVNALPSDMPKAAHEAIAFSYTYMYLCRHTDTFRARVLCVCAPGEQALERRQPQVSHGRSEAHARMNVVLVFSFLCGCFHGRCMLNIAHTHTTHIYTLPYISAVVCMRGVYACCRSSSMRVCVLV